MGRLLLLAGCLLALVLTPDRVQTACSSDQLKSLKDAKFSLGDIRTLCGMDEQKPTTLKTPEKAGEPKGIGPEKSTKSKLIEQPKEQACRQDETSIKQSYQQCTASVQKSRSKDEGECKVEFRDCMQGSQRGDPPSWAARCRREQSECLRDATKDADEATRECKQEHDKDMSAYGCK